MKVLKWDEFRSERADRQLAVVIGVFDGLHIGHRELVSRVVGRGGLSSAVVTFADNPKKILTPESFDGRLSTLDQKLSLIEAMGVDLSVLIDFSGDFSKLPGRQFLSLLSESSRLRYLAVGSDFRCGYGLDTDAKGVRDFCQSRSVDVELLGAVQWAGLAVSSSRIRKAIVAGRIEEAEAMLGRPYEIDLRGARLAASDPVVPTGGQASPPAGRYEARLSYEGTLREAADFVARAETDGSWVLPLEAFSFAQSVAPGPLGLQVIRRVSRE